MRRLWLHDLPVVFDSIGPMGTWVRDSLGRPHCIFTTGKRVYECLRQTPEQMASGVNYCPRCSWERRAYTCGGSCDMQFNKAGCA